MRILQITAFSGWGCTGRIAVGIHDVLVRQNHESVIAWGRINTAPPSVPTIRIGNRLDQQLHGLYTRITDQCGFGSFCVTRQFLKKLDRIQPDLVQLHIMHGYYIHLELLFQYLKEKRIPVVWTFHDCWAFTGHCPYFDLAGCDRWKTGCHHCPQKFHHPKSWLLDRSQQNWIRKKKLFSGADNLTIVTPSAWMAGLVRQSFLKDCPVEVIRNGINLEQFRPTYGNLTAQLGLTDKKIILGVSSTWADSKGLRDFIRLAPLLPQDFRIVLVGLNRQQVNRMPERIIGLERTDSLRKLAELYTAAAVFVNPTYEDNFPTTNLEALACGTPVVTYQTGGSVEAAGNRFGKIIPCGDVAALGDYLKSDDWKQFSSEECAAYAAGFDEQQKFLQYVRLYETILGSNRHE